jgi:hypothetical protein
MCTTAENPSRRNAARNYLQNLRDRSGQSKSSWHRPWPLSDPGNHSETGRDIWYEAKENAQILFLLCPMINRKIKFTVQFLFRLISENHCKSTLTQEAAGNE